jgi:hypothetical protein
MSPNRVSDSNGPRPFHDIGRATERREVVAAVAYQIQRVSHGGASPGNTGPKTPIGQFTM